MDDGGNTVRDMVLGQSGAAAIVVAALYFVGVLVTLGDWMRTGFSGYASLLTSCVCALPLGASALSQTTVHA